MSHQVGDVHIPNLLTRSFSVAIIGNLKVVGGGPESQRLEAKRFHAGRVRSKTSSLYIVEGDHIYRVFYPLVI